jgi:hypothetical protein
VSRFGSANAFLGGDTPLRTYYKFNDIEKEVAAARVYGGMHFRHSGMNGAQLGRKVTRNMVKNFFQTLQ